jgi:hypothetical protein
MFFYNLQNSSPAAITHSTFYNFSSWENVVKWITKQLLFYDVVLTTDEPATVT